MKFEIARGKVIKGTDPDVLKFGDIVELDESTLDLSVNGHGSLAGAKGKYVLTAHRDRAIGYVKNKHYPNMGIVIDFMRDSNGKILLARVVTTSPPTVSDDNAGEWEGDPT